ncbi:MAG: hypothetical protein ACXVAE_04085 [Candidatus Limnocylindrales bacterium]
MIRRALVAGVGLAAASAATYVYAVRPWWRRWGVDPAEAAKPVLGDELVPDAPISETRGITIDAPPAAVWPWLPQMGFGRGGWYSYDQLDMSGRSSDGLLPEFREIKPGDILPTDPRGGFVVKAVEPGRALVVYLDREIVAEQLKAAEERGEAVAQPTNMRATGAFLGAATPPDFKVSWAWAIEPLGETQSRLIERFRAVWTPAEGQGAPPVAMQRAMQPMMSFGVFVMARKQLLGIRERAERLYREGGLEEPAKPAARTEPAATVAVEPVADFESPIDATEPVSA